jgi:hypothetical protein
VYYANEVDSATYRDDDSSYKENNILLAAYIMICRRMELQNEWMFCLIHIYLYEVWHTFAFIISISGQ